MLRVEFSTTERVEQVISDLENLKSRVAGIETRYSILSQDYTQICEDALSLISKLKPPLEAVAQAQERVPVTASRTGNHRKPKRTAHKPDGKRARNPLHVKVPASKPKKAEPSATNGIDKTAEDQKNAGGTSPEISTEAVALYDNMEMAPAAEVAEKHDIALSPLIPAAEDPKIYYSSPSLEDLLKFQRRQVKKARKKSRISPASCIDLVGKYIEIGLDKLGDGLIFPFVLVASLVNKVTHRSKGRQ